ncbi:hypothetical protein GQ457_17G020000 [Hibiscus cannabinus]
MGASVFQIMDRKTQVAGDAGEELTTVEGTIELRGVHFSYPSRPDIVIFNDFDLKVRSGKSMPLVGQSGSGKSSVLVLILRFYDPTAGKVRVTRQKLANEECKLFGGQEQRVAIARAVLKNPEIALDRLSRNRTTVMVAHRLSTTKNADKISVIQGGKVIEQGTHSSLIENKDGLYFKLINLQQQKQLEH